MTEAEAPRGQTAAGGFFDRRMAAAIAVYLLVVLTYVQPRVTNDGLSYLAFMRRLFGEQSDGYAYQFGAEFWNAPAFLVARLAGAFGLHDVDGLPLEELALTIGSVLAVLLLFPLGWLLLTRLELEHAPLLILLTIFGTPLVYSVLFSPSDAHSTDAFAGTLLALALLALSTAPTVSWKLALAAGALLGWMTTIRYANCVLVVGVGVVIVARRAWRPGLVAAAAALLAGCLLLGLPAVRGIPYGVTANPAYQVEAGGIGGEIQVDPLVPVKMLFTLRRGLFVWTPLTALSVIGIVLLWRRDRKRRLFLTALCAAAVALLVVHVLWGRYWWGGFGFSQRFLTGLFPLYLLGLAELMRRRFVLVTVLATLCVGYTGFLALYHYYGYQGINEKDGVDRIVELYRSGEETPQEFVRNKVGEPVVDRWSTYARLVTRR